MRQGARGYMREHRFGALLLDVWHFGFLGFCDYSYLDRVCFGEEMSSGNSEKKNMYYLDFT